MADRYRRTRSHPLLGEVSTQLERRSWQLLLLLAETPDAARPADDARVRGYLG